MTRDRREEEGVRMKQENLKGTPGKEKGDYTGSKYRKGKERDWERK